MREKIMLNEGTLRHLSLDEALAIARETGFSSFGVWMTAFRDYMHKGHDLDDTCALITSSGLNIEELAFLKDWMFADGEKKVEVFREAKEMCQIAQMIGAKCICAIAVGDKGDEALAVRNFSELCDMAARYGVKIGLEYFPLRGVNTITTTMKIIEMAEKPNGGLILDSFHFFKGPSTWVDLESLPGEKIFSVHISDLPALDESISLVAQARNYRVLPGEGIFELEKFVRTLVARDYNGYFSLEILNESYRDRDMAEICSRGMIALEGILLSVVEKEREEEASEGTISFRIGGGK